MSGESLTLLVRKKKAQWLRRVMLHPKLTPTQKCLAYWISDHLNAVTLDCWPAQSTLAHELGGKCSRTIQRAARALAKVCVITIKRNRFGKSEYRYAPIFPADAEQDTVLNRGHTEVRNRDKDVKESSLTIPLTSYSTDVRDVFPEQWHKPAFNRQQRGALEVEVAKLLGDDGLDILARLSQIDDFAVTRLCRAHADGVLDRRDLVAAKLAARRT